MLLAHCSGSAKGKFIRLYLLLSTLVRCVRSHNGHLSHRLFIFGLFHQGIAINLATVITDQRWHPAAQNIFWWLFGMWQPFENREVEKTYAYCCPTYEYTHINYPWANIKWIRYKLLYRINNVTRLAFCYCSPFNIIFSCIIVFMNAYILYNKDGYYLTFNASVFLDEYDTDAFGQKWIGDIQVYEMV